MINFIGNSGYTQKSITFLCTNNEHVENEITNNIIYMCSKENQTLSVNLTKHVEGLYAGNDKMLLEYREHLHKETYCVRELGNYTE